MVNPKYDDPVFTFDGQHVYIVTDDGSVLIVETKPKRGRKKKDEEDEG